MVETDWLPPSPVGPLRWNRKLRGASGACCLTYFSAAGLARSTGVGRADALSGCAGTVLPSDAVGLRSVQSIDAAFERLIQ